MQSDFNCTPGAHRRAAEALNDWKRTKAFLWLSIYFLGTIVGMTGLFHLVSKLFWADVIRYNYYNGASSDKIRNITYAFASLAFSPLAVCFLIYGGYVAVFFGKKSLIWSWRYARFFCYIDDSRKKVDLDWDPPKWLKHSIRNTVLGIVFFGLFGAFYCDWILAAVARNWAGLPSNDIAVLFWVYFVAKRLPMLSL